MQTHTHRVIVRLPLRMVVPFPVFTPKRSRLPHFNFRLPEPTFPRPLPRIAILPARSLRQAGQRHAARKATTLAVVARLSARISPNVLSPFQRLASSFPSLTGRIAGVTRSGSSDRPIIGPEPNTLPLDHHRVFHTCPTSEKRPQTLALLHRLFAPPPKGRFYYAAPQVRIQGVCVRNLKKLFRLASSAFRNHVIRTESSS